MEEQERRRRRRRLRKHRLQCEEDETRPRIL